MNLLKKIALVSVSVLSTLLSAYVLYAFVVAQQIRDKTTEEILKNHRAENPLPHICCATLRCDTECCQKLLQQGYDPDQRCTIVVSRLNQQEITLEQVSPLMISAQQNDTAMFDLLSRYGANVRCKDFYNRDLLMIASWFSSREIVKKLLSCADGIDWLSNKDINGNDALYYAQISGDLEIISMLREYGFSTKSFPSCGVHNRAYKNNTTE